MKIERTKYINIFLYCIQKRFVKAVVYFLKSEETRS